MVKNTNYLLQELQGITQNGNETHDSIEPDQASITSRSDPVRQGHLGRLFHPRFGLGQSQSKISVHPENSFFDIRSQKKFLRIEERIEELKEIFSLTVYQRNCFLGVQEFCSGSGRVQIGDETNGPNDLAVQGPKEIFSLTVYQRNVSWN